MHLRDGGPGEGSVCVCVRVCVVIALDHFPALFVFYILHWVSQQNFHL